MLKTVSNVLHVGVIWSGGLTKQTVSVIIHAAWHTPPVTPQTGNLWINAEKLLFGVFMYPLLKASFAARRNEYGPVSTACTPCRYQLTKFSLAAPSVS